MVVFLDGSLSVSEVVAGAGPRVPAPASSCPPSEMKTKKQHRLICVLQSFRGGFWGRGDDSLLNI